MQPNACFAAIGGVRACSFSTSDYFSRTNWCGRQNRRRPQDRCLRSCTPQWGEAAAALVGALPTGPALLCCDTLLFNAQPYCKVLLSTLRMSQCLCHALPCFILVFFHVSILQISWYCVLYFLSQDIFFMTSFVFKKQI